MRYPIGRIVGTGGSLFTLLGLALICIASVSCFFFGIGPPPPGGPIGILEVASGLTSPLKLVAVPDGSGRLFVVDQIGLVRIIDGSGTLLPAPFLDIRDRMIAISTGGDERGFLGMAFHPDYSVNGRFFVFYTAPKGNDIPANFDSESHISEFQVMTGDENTADPTSERVLLRLGQPQPNHKGGDLAFGPDGYLYIVTGDGGGGGDVGEGHTPNLGNAQDKSNLLGKILRIDVDHGDQYAIPSDNPFVLDPSARGEIYAYGFRNPYRFSFDSGGARRLFVGDVGQALIEEVDIVVRGGNYGWNIREGTQCYNPNDSRNPLADCPMQGVDATPLVAPIVEYGHSGDGDAPRGVSVIGGCVYRGSGVPSLAGRYVFGDWSRGFLFGDGSIFAATEGLGGAWTMEELEIAGSTGGRLGRFVLGFGADAGGEVYVLTSDVRMPTGESGRVLKIVSPE